MLLTRPAGPTFDIEQRAEAPLSLCLIMKRISDFRNANGTFMHPLTTRDLSSYGILIRPDETFGLNEEKDVDASYMIIYVKYMYIK